MRLPSYVYKQVKTRTLPQDMLYMVKKQRNVAFLWYRSLTCAFVCPWALKSWKYPFFTTYRRPIDIKERIFATFKFIFCLEYCLRKQKWYHLCLVRYIRASLGQNLKIFKIIFFLPIDHCAMACARCEIAVGIYMTLKNMCLNLCFPLAS